MFADSPVRNRRYVKLRIFVASPQDVLPERQRLQTKIHAFNRLGGAADERGVVFEVLDWHTHVGPFMGRPQGGIIDQLPVELWDIFVGILWLRFGLPTGAVDEGNHSYSSGTEEEFALAYDSLKKTGRPKILFYQCVRSPQDINDIDPDQLSRVKRFFGSFAANAEHPGLVQKYRDIEEFEEHLSRDLINFLRDLSPVQQALFSDSLDATPEDKVRLRTQSELQPGRGET